LTGDGSARFAAVPLSDGGTPAQEWLRPMGLPALDLTECQGLIVVAPHPDDETLGLGSMAAQLAASGVDVAVVSVSDGGAAEPDASPSQRIRLESRRRSELRRATEVLEIGAPISLGLPDGRLAEHQGELTELLAAILDKAAPGTWCAATWRGDGHPDHEAVGRAAAAACARTDTTLMEYPVWMWHWASPADPAVPWNRARSVPVSAWARHRKYLATQCFRSQFEPSAQDRAPVLPEFVVQRLLAVGELVFV
jgi:LmbE family N-acetylglucosaminyl deacetylase